jgi:hypothetical protein
MADTWLHLSTTTVQFTQFTPTVPTQQAYGRGVGTYCASRMQDSEDHPDNPLLTIHLPCTMDESLTKLYLVGGTEGVQTVNNISTVNQLLTVQYSGLTYVLLGDINVSSHVDFAASTVAINTQCKPITQACDAVAIEWTKYHCSDQFQGEFDTADANGTSFQTSWRMNFFNDSTLETPAETGNSSFPTGQNPIYIAMAAVANGAFFGLFPNQTEDTEPALINDPDVLADTEGGLSFMLLCNATIYDAEYTWINGSFGNFSSLNPSNTTMANIINGPQQKNTTFGLNQFVNGAVLATFSRTADELAQKMAQVYSQTALGLAAGVFSSRANLEEQTRQEFLVARVPLAPFYTLIAFNLVYAIVGGVVAVIALRATGGEGVLEARAGLSVWGIVAHGFEVFDETRKIRKVEDLFEESRVGAVKVDVIGIEKAEGVRWRLRTWEAM